MYLPLQMVSLTSTSRAIFIVPIFSVQRLCENGRVSLLLPGTSKNRKRKERYHQNVKRKYQDFTENNGISEPDLHNEQTATLGTKIAILV